MKPGFIIHLVLLPALSLLSCQGSQERLSFLPAANLNLVLEAPITRWDEAIPLGNGILGGLLWGEGNTIRLSLDRGDLWDLRIPSRFSEPDFTWLELKKLVDSGNMDEVKHRFDSYYDELKYPTKLPGGRLEITLDQSRQVKTFALDLATATGSALLQNGDRITGFFSATLPVALFRIPGPAPKNLRLIAPAAVTELGYPAAQSGSQNSEHWFLQETTEGLQYAVVLATRRVGAETLVALTISASREGADPVQEGINLVRQVLTTGWQPLLTAHQQYWRDFWSTSRLWLPDLQHLRHYYLVQYFYGAASRPGAPSIPLQGVWTADDGTLPPWHGDYHHDLNTQMTYCAYQTAGRFQEGACFLDHMFRLLPKFREFARHFYQAPGAAIPGVMTQEGDPMTGWVMYSLAPTNGAWVGYLFYQHWLYTQNNKDLERGYQFCSELAECLENLLNRDEMGFLKLPLSSSPEIFDNTRRAFLRPNSNYDRDCLEALFNGLTHMAQALGQTAAATKWQVLAKQLPPRHVDSANVLMYSENEKMLYSHRHFSSTMAIHPFDLLTIDGTDQDRAVIRATMQRCDSLGTAWWCGYSYSWMACMRARIGDAEAALRHLDIYEKAFISRNGFHLNGDQLKAGYSNFHYRPFTLEGNFLASQAVQELLLQSWHGIVRIFPAVPERWQDVQFERLRAEGGFEVSARRKNGKITSLGIKASTETTLKLLDNFADQHPGWNRDDVVKEGKYYVLTMAAGDVLTADFN